MRRLLALLCFAWLASPASATNLAPLRPLFLPRLASEAASLGLPAEIADAVAMVETAYHPEAIGSSGEIGLMQVLPSTAAQLGFRGTPRQLADPATNIHLGVTYLARAWAQSGGDICRALMKYRAGLGEEVMTPLSAQYCSRAIAWLRAPQSMSLAFNALDAEAPAGPEPDAHVIAIAPALATQSNMRPPAVLPPGWVRPGNTAQPSSHHSHHGQYRRYLAATQANVALALAGR